MECLPEDADKPIQASLCTVCSGGSGPPQRSPWQATVTEAMRGVGALLARVQNAKDVRRSGLSGTLPIRAPLEKRFANKSVFMQIRDDNPGERRTATTGFEDLDKLASS